MQSVVSTSLVPHGLAAELPVELDGWNLGSNSSVFGVVGADQVDRVHPAVAGGFDQVLVP